MNIKYFYHSLNSEKDLEKLIENEQTEELHLEFKEKSDSRDGKLGGSDKENFANGLSQFANSDGGIQVWGIETEAPLDKAKNLKPIQEVDTFIERLHSYSNEAVQPHVDEVLIKPIYTKKNNKSGYVKVLIPRSDKTPHRSMKTREYYKRGAKGKYRLEHFDLEDMFGRRQKPLLKVLLKSKATIDFEAIKPKKDAEGFLPPIVYEIYVSNEGRAIGRDSQIIIWLPEEKNIKAELRLKQIPHSRIDEMHKGLPTYQISCQNNLFYPEVDTRIGEFVLKFHENYFSKGNMIVAWVINADNMTRQKGLSKI